MQDANVFFQDNVRLVQRLIELKKENFEIAIYPVEDHGFVQPTSWLDEYRRIFKLFETNLKRWRYSSLALAIPQGGFKEWLEHPAAPSRRRAGGMESTAEAALQSPWMEKMARAGYAARGAVYALVGLLAVQTAFGARSTPRIPAALSRKLPARARRSSG